MDNASIVTQVKDLIASNTLDASAILTAAGLALIGLAFLGFVLRKSRRAAAGNVG